MARESARGGGGDTARTQTQYVSARDSARSAQYSSRSDDILETVRSDWETARVESKLKKLMDEKQSIMARIAEVDDALDLEEAKKRNTTFGRRSGKR